MDYTMKEIVNFVREQDIKFIRLSFCDVLGNYKNISIMPDELEKAFNTGVSVDGSAICGFQKVSNSDLFLRPDPSTLTLLPYRPSENRVMRFICDIVTPDGVPFESDPRACLKKSINRAFDMGYIVKLSTESEFYLFKNDENGEPTFNPIDKGSYLDMTPLDRGENIRREICLCLEEMGLFPESSHHEQGPGQNEIDFKYSDALSAADNFLNFKSMVKAISLKHDIFASFMPKPMPGKAGNGLHINLSLQVGGENIFHIGSTPEDKPADWFMAGILEKASELSAVINPTKNSYERLGSHEAPRYIGWSHINRSQYIRIPAAAKENSRMELRAADNAINPYLAFSAIIEAGLDGIENKTKLGCAIVRNTFEDNKGLPVLPNSLDEAINIAKTSELLQRSFSKELLEKYLLELKNRADKESRESLLSII